MAWCTFCGLFPLSSNDYEESNEISNVNSFYEYDPESGLSNSQSMSMSNDPSDVRDGKLKKKKSQYKEQFEKALEDHKVNEQEKVKSVRTPTLTEKVDIPKMQKKYVPNSPSQLSPHSKERSSNSSTGSTSNEQPDTFE